MKELLEVDVMVPDDVNPVEGVGVTVESIEGNVPTVAEADAELEDELVGADDTDAEPVGALLLVGLVPTAKVAAPVAVVVADGDEEPEELPVKLAEGVHDGHRGGVK